MMTIGHSVSADDFTLTLSGEIRRVRSRHPAEGNEGKIKKGYKI